MAMKLDIPAGEFDAYIFDCDGTLADTMPLHYRAWCAAMAEYQADFPEAFFYELGGVPTATIVEILNARHGYSMPVEETAYKKEQFYLEMIPEILPIEPVVALVNEYAGKKPLAVASGGHRRVVLQTLGALQLVERFDAIVTSDDYTRGKPFPDPYLLAAERLGIAPGKCLVFEDTATGIEAAKAAGMQWVLVPPPERRRV